MNVVLAALLHCVRSIGYLACPSRRIVPIIFGVFLGLLLGICLKIEHASEDTQLHIQLKVERLVKDSGKLTRPVWLRCVVLVQPTTQKQHKYLLAVSDTYASKCNETLFFTDSPALLEKFSDSLNMFLLEGLNSAKWSFFLRVLRFIEARPPTISTNATIQWTAFVNEQTYLLIDNLLLLIAQAGGPTILGRLENIKSPLSLLFPFTQTTAFCMDSGIALSDQAIHLIVGNNNQECLSSNWLIPKYTGKALLKCCRQIGASILDPIDQDGHHLFVKTSLRSLFSKPQQALSFLLPRQSISQQKSVVSDCCSHKAIGFGQLSYRDIRLLHYFVNQMRVFGV